jgi:hypothetical protein
MTVLAIYCFFFFVVSRAIRGCFAAVPAKQTQTRVEITTVIPLVLVQPPAFTPLNNDDLKWLEQQ